MSVVVAVDVVVTGGAANFEWILVHYYIAMHYALNYSSEDSPFANQFECALAFFHALE